MIRVHKMASGIEGIVSRHRTSCSSIEMSNGQPAAARRLTATAKHLYSGPIVDAHHHFLDPVRFQSHHNILRDALRANAAPGTSSELPSFKPSDYHSQFHEAGVDVVKSVYMEVIADDFVEEVRYVQGLKDSESWAWAGAVIGCANPAAPDFEETLKALLSASPLVRGIRWILNWPGFITPTRPDKDYLKDPAFRAGFSLLEKYGLVFDLQLNAQQLPEAANLVAAFPGVPVCLEHIGMPVIWPADTDTPDNLALSAWREGMRQMAAIPHVTVQLDECE